MNKFVNISQLILSCIMLFAVVVQHCGTYHTWKHRIVRWLSCISCIHLSHMETGTYIMDGVSK